MTAINFSSSTAYPVVPQPGFFSNVFKQLKTNRDALNIAREGLSQLQDARATVELKRVTLELARVELQMFTLEVDFFQVIDNRLTLLSRQRVGETDQLVAQRLDKAIADYSQVRNQLGSEARTWEIPAPNNYIAGTEVFNNRNALPRYDLNQDYGALKQLGRDFLSPVVQAYNNTRGYRVRPPISQNDREQGYRVGLQGQVSHVAQSAVFNGQVMHSNA
jgi:hypothetical protein